MSHSHPIDLDAAWALAALVSPRPRVRLAPRTADGQIANAYTATRALSQSAPTEPWAVLLADEAGVFRLLCFDLDAHEGTLESVSRVERDLARLTELLDLAGVPHLVCASGPGGGRHVWVRVPGGIPADVVRSLARSLRALAGSLDITALCNPAAGCVRSPGAPHRFGGVSVPLGDPERWARKPAHPEQIHLLHRLVVDQTRDLVVPEAAPAPLVGVSTDAKGRRFLRGVRRALPAASAAAAARVQGADASRDAWRVLLGAARSCWRYEDVARLAFGEKAPGLEHVRTARMPNGRRRPRRDGGSHLAHQWNRAVAQVAATPVTPRPVTELDGEPDDFDQRARSCSQQCLDVLEAMAATHGRWRHGGGAADERVLRALVLLVAQAVQMEVEADIRRLAIACGISRETARQSLWRLESSGWIRQVREAEGPHGAVWAINPRSTVHRDRDERLPQAHSAPPGTGRLMREGVIAELEVWLQVASHDAFAPGALGLAAGNVVASAHCAEAPPSASEPTGDLAASPPARARRSLSADDADLLEDCLLAGIDPTESLAGMLASAHLVAVFSGTARTGERRRRRYELERVVWAWWLAETEWMTAPRRSDPRRRAFPGQGALGVGGGGVVHVPFPRVLGRGSWRRAAALVSGGFVPHAGDVVAAAA